MHRKLAMAAAVGAALAVVPSAFAQSTDTTAPVLNVGTLTPTAAAQRNGNPPAAPSTSTGNSDWFTQAAPTVLNLTATDDVGVDKLQYSTDNGATWTDIAITPGKSVSGTASFNTEGNTTVRYRALDAAGNAANGVAATATLNQAAAVGATSIRLSSTNGRAAGDTLVIDTGDNQETVKIATIIAGNPASPNPNVTLASPLTKAHAANAAIQAIPPYRVINVRIDRTAPTGAWPSGVGANNQIGHGAAAITPTRTDTGGSGSPAVRDTWLDGTWVYPLPLDPSKLSLGKHTWTLGLTDVAGNGNKVAFTFNVVTSFADIDALLTRNSSAIGAANATALKATLAAAKAKADANDAVGAVAGLEAFVSQVRSTVTTTSLSNLFVTDAQDVIRQQRGLPAPTVDGLGITTERYPGQPRHPYLTPAMPTANPGAKFKVLVIANKNDGSFRHPAIEDAEVTLQELGAAKGFDVDLWDPSWPTQSLPDTPFTSAANLAKYAVIIGDSSVGNNTFNAAYTMKDGTVVDERAAFKGYINNGGGYVALHAANDSMHTWQFPTGGPLWYQDLLGGLFVSHPANQNGFGTDCGSCYWAEVVTEDPSHPSTSPAVVATKVPVADELYHFDRKPRGYIHPLQLLNESTYVGAMGVGTNSGNIEGGDHPIVWCSNFDGGREWSQVLGHNWELYRNVPWFRESIYQGILTAAGMKPANCVTHIEVKRLLASLGTSGGLTAGAVTAGTAAVDAAFTKYMTLTQGGYSSSLSDIDALRAIAQDPASGDAASRAKVQVKAQELKDWMLVLLGAVSTPGSANGTVPATLSLTLGAPASFGGLTPGVGKTYTASTSATVISSAGDATLSVSDPSNTATGRLVNGTFSLAAALQAAATSPLGAGGALANVGGSSAPTNLLTYSGPVANDPVAISFSQAVGANEALRTGTYSKTLTFTLSTTTP
ncbi:ThuA domain-containing protein [Solirubrobacter soli]|uniref:ThuA domain-containing protein n=1 Tax=Solirubrobacter soli TaxID=363832 RepID=UPI0003FE0E5E|nr:ThuA domain-containing protein [Solirubrobacter soli]